MLGSSLLEVLKELCNDKGLLVPYDGNYFTVEVNEDSEKYVEKLLVDFEKMEGYQLRLLNQAGNASFQVGIHQASVPDSVLFDHILESLEQFEEGKNYQGELSVQSRGMYLLYEESFKYSGNFGFGIQNQGGERKYVVKTDIPEILDSFAMAQIPVQGNKAVFGGESVQALDQVCENVVSSLQNDSIQKEDSEVSLYEKIIRNKQGENILVRLSITRQVVDGNDERLVHVAYIDKDSGLITGNQIFSYENGEQFDQDVLPEVIDGFTRQSAFNNGDVQLKQGENGECYITSNEDQLIMEGYSIDEVNSLLTYDKEHHLFGDENGVVDISGLEEEGVVSYEDTGIALEDQLLEKKDSDKEMEQDGPKLAKSLGEMPSNAGLTNSLGLFLFLLVDIAAIVVGILLLNH